MLGEEYECKAKKGGGFLIRKELKEIMEQWIMWHISIELVHGYAEIIIERF